MNIAKGKLAYVVNDQTLAHAKAYTDLEIADKIMELSESSYDITVEKFTYLTGNSGDEYPKEMQGECFVAFIHRCDGSMQDIGIQEAVEDSTFSKVESKVVDWIIDNSLEQFGCWVLDADGFAEFKRNKKE